MIRNCAIVVLLALFAPFIQADPRPWTFTYDTYAEGKGNAEFEQWATWNTHKSSEHGYNLFQFREEIEYGLTDNFDISIYAPSWNYEDSKDRRGTHYDSVGVEGILYLSKPSDLVGVALYSEINAGEAGREFEFEEKLLLHKDIGRWSFAYNLVLETEIDREKNDEGERENEVTGILGHTAAVAYSVNRNWRLGGELVIESSYEDWSRYQDTTAYAGPSINYTGNGIPGTKMNWWVTVTPAFQLSSVDDEPDFMVRMIAGLEF
jgi:hypothetical protein